jgi:hypothetical protein
MVAFLTAGKPGSQAATVTEFFGNQQLYGGFLLRIRAILHARPQIPALQLPEVTARKPASCQ